MKTEDGRQKKGSMPNGFWGLVVVWIVLLGFCGYWWYEGSYFPIWTSLAFFAVLTALITKFSMRLW